jgi:hypothetical protein
LLHLKTSQSPRMSALSGVGRCNIAWCGGTRGTVAPARICGGGFR